MGVAAPTDLSTLQLLAGLSDGLDGVVKLDLSWEAVDHLVEGLGDSLGRLGQTQLLVGGVGVLDRCLGLTDQSHALIHHLHTHTPTHSNVILGYLAISMKGKPPMT